MAKTTKRHLLSSRIIRESHKDTPCYEITLPSLDSHEYGRDVEFAESYAVLRCDELNSVTSTIKELIVAGKTQKLSEALKKDFVLQVAFAGCVNQNLSKANGGTTTDSITGLKLTTITSHYGRTNTTSYSAEQEFVSRNTMEQLVLAGKLGELLDLADKSDRINGSGTRQVLLSALAQLALEDHERADFSGLDLRGANFGSAKLARSDFTGAQVNGIRFDNQCDFRQCRDGNLLVAHFWRPWKTNITLVNQRLQALEDYATNERNMPKGCQKRMAITTFCATSKVALTNGSLTTISQRRDVYQALTNLKQVCSGNRNANYLVGEVLACLGLGVVLYLAAASYNYCTTGHFGLFSRPISEARVDDVIAAGTVAAPPTSAPR